MSKYTLAKQCLSDLTSNAGEYNATEDEALEALIVVAVEALAKCAGKKRAADVLQYELSNVGGSVDTVFLRAR